jgi:hypothetical protein
LIYKRHQQKHENESRMISHEQLIAASSNFNTACRFTYLNTTLQCPVEETIIRTSATFHPIYSHPPDVSR